MWFEPKRQTLVKSLSQKLQVSTSYYTASKFTHFFKYFQTRIHRVEIVKINVEMCQFPRIAVQACRFSKQKFRRARAYHFGGSYTRTYRAYDNWTMTGLDYNTAFMEMRIRHSSHENAPFQSDLCLELLLRHVHETCWQVLCMHFETKVGW